MKRLKILLALTLFYFDVFSQFHLPEILVSSPIFIENNIGGTGSGFLIQDSTSVYFVTAKHIIIDSRTNKVIDYNIKLTTYANDPSIDEKKIIKVNIKKAISANLLYVKDNIDVLIIKIGVIKPLSDKIGSIYYYDDIIQNTEASWINPIHIKIIKNYEDIFVGDNIFLFGYPTSIGLKRAPQFDYSKPLIRQGVVAGKYDKLKTLILDCPIYYGNSGGPVIRKLNFGNTVEYHLIGLVTQFIPYEEQWINKKSGLTSTDISNSGYSVAISGDKILELIEELRIKNFNLKLK